MRVLRALEPSRYRSTLALLAATIVASGLLAASAAPADAWYRGNVWVNFGTWNCPSGGSVKGIYWAVDGFSVGPAGGDWGDNVIYPPVRIGASNGLSYQLSCRTWWGWTYRGAVSQRWFTTSYNGQSYWF